MNAAAESKPVDIMDLVNKNFPPKNQAQNIIGAYGNQASNPSYATSGLPDHLLSCVDRARNAVQNEANKAAASVNSANHMASMYPQFTVSNVLSGNTGLRGVAAGPSQNQHFSVKMGTHASQPLQQPYDLRDGDKTPVPGPHQHAGNSNYGFVVPTGFQHLGMNNNGHQIMQQPQHSQAGQKMQLQQCNQAVSNQVSHPHILGSNHGMPMQAMAPKNGQAKMPVSNPATQLVLASASSSRDSSPPLDLFAPPTMRMKSTRSSMLNTLAGYGVPEESRLLSPAYFPFVENATVRPRLPQYGVLLIKNVSLPV
jgi:hypothetical protein